MRQRNINRGYMIGDKWYSEKHYKELIGIIRMLKEGLEEIASDDSSEGEVAVEILQSMEDICKRSNRADIQNLPKLLNTYGS